MFSLRVSLFVYIAIFMVFCVNKIFGESHLRNRIVNGQDARQNQFPYFASIRDYVKLDHFCGGSIISDQHILTAAQCFSDSSSKPNNIVALVGALYRKEDGLLMNISKIVIHSGFELKIFKNDLALLHTANEIIFSQEVKPIALPKTNIPRNGALPVLLSGFGSLWGPLHADSNLNKPEYLQWTPTVIGDQKECLSQLNRLTDSKLKNWLQEIKGINGDNVMFSLMNQMHGVCVGDSGGPVASQNNQVLIGVISWSHGYDRGFPEVYTNVYTQLDWIRDTMKPKGNITQKLFIIAT